MQDVLDRFRCTPTLGLSRPVLHAQAWRTDRFLRHLDASIIVADNKAPGAGEGCPSV